MYLTYAKMIFVEHGFILCSTSSPSDAANATWHKMEMNGWVEFISNGRADIYCIKRDVIANHFSDLLDFAKKRFGEPPAPPTLWQSLLVSPSTE
jgi:hypothetical protein